MGVKVLGGQFVDHIPQPDMHEVPEVTNRAGNNWHDSLGAGHF